jgi:DNA-binding MarR family transcriptional regulator
VTNDAPVPLTAEEEAFFRAFAHSMLTVRRAFDADLMGDQGMSVSEYAVLMHLSEAPDRRLRMSDLAVCCDLSVSGMTRVVSRLEAQRLVQRERSPADGRSWNALLTDAGLQRLRQAWPTHLASVRRHVIDHLHAAGVDLPSLTTAFEHFAADTPRAEEGHGLDERPSAGHRGS